MGFDLLLVQFLECGSLRCVSTLLVLWVWMACMGLVSKRSLSCALADYVKLDVFCVAFFHGCIG